MKIQLISDLHIGVCQYTPVAAGADVIVVAGDVDAGFDTNVYKLFSEMLFSSPQAHIVYVAGNHEFYGKDINAFRAELRKFCGPASAGGEFNDGLEKRFHFLDNDEVVIDGVRFLGTTLWTNFELFGESEKQACMAEAVRRLNDFYHIKIDGRLFTPQDSIDLHNEAVKWLENKLKHEPFDGETVVVTHHAPSFASVVPHYQHDPLSACYASKLDHLTGLNALWIHGHTHNSLDYMIDKTRVVCNPRGYARNANSNENRSFQPALVITVGEPALSSEAEALEDGEQEKIDALLRIEKLHNEEFEMDYYDLNQLPQTLAEEYWKDRFGSTQPGIDGASAVYTWDFEPWRRQYLKQLGVEQGGKGNKP
jgi:predicted phosphodiesterase